MTTTQRLKVTGIYLTSAAILFLALAVAMAPYTRTVITHLPTGGILISYWNVDLLGWTIIAAACLIALLPAARFARRYKP